MILIADSGSTKTDWCAEQNGRIIKRMSTQGINPFHQTQDTIVAIITDQLLPQMDDDDMWGIDELYFYGSGCRAEMLPVMQGLLSQLFIDTHIECHSDLLAAARAVCGNKEGLACILGTGSNSCLYDGTKVVRNTPPLGYILGDEGSGAVLGRLFLNALFKGRLSVQTREAFEEHTGLSLTSVMEKVYREPMANRFLATMCPFIAQNISDDHIHDLVVDNFRSFLRYNLTPYGRYDLQLGAIGSVAFYFKKQLAEAAEIERRQIGKIVRSPMEGLVDYHK